MTDQPKPNSGRKLFFGLFIFPLLIAMGMALLLVSVIFLTHEEETPQSLIAAIKTGPPGKRWQKAYELSNELNREGSGLRTEAVLHEIIRILRDRERYDAKTRGYMAVAMSHFDSPEAVRALIDVLPEEETEVQIYALWSLGVLDAKEEASSVAPFLNHEDPSLRKMAAYVLGVIGNASMVPPLREKLLDPSADVRWNAALALARLGSGSGAEVLLAMLDRASLENVHRLAEPEIEKIMINAAKGLALIREPKSIKILSIVSKEDRNLKVRQAALDALRYIQQS